MSFAKIELLPLLLAVSCRPRPGRKSSFPKLQTIRKRTPALIGHCRHVLFFVCVFKAVFVIEKRTKLITLHLSYVCICVNEGRLHAENRNNDSSFFPIYSYIIFCSTPYQRSCKLYNCTLVFVHFCALFLSFHRCRSCK